MINVRTTKEKYTLGKIIRDHIKIEESFPYDDVDFPATTVDEKEIKEIIDEFDKKMSIYNIKK